MAAKQELILYGVVVTAGAVGLGVGAYFLGKRWLNSNHHEANPYEGSKRVNEYMAFHYTPSEEYMSFTYGPKDALDFPKRCAELCLKHKQEGVLSRALDVGCSVGRATFELARDYSEVWGVDFSQANIDKSQELKEVGQADYWLVTEGDLREKKTAVVDVAIDRTRVQFTVGDACNLPQLGQFGCVFAGNLICRLPKPRKFLDALPELIVPGGILVLTTPYAWLEQFTPKERWLGGYLRDDQEVRGFDTIKQILQPNFDLVEMLDMPYLIREIFREHQWGTAQATVWRRKP